jgi:hypothetical protein
MMEMILVCLFLLMILQIVPKHGAMKGIQNFTMTRSGFSFRISFPTLSQLSGLIELTFIFIGISAGAGSDEYCVFPGKRKPGY